MPGNLAATQEPPVFDLIEEAILLLKRIGLPAYGLYGAGTLGFLWAFLDFFAHMSRNAMASIHLAEYSFLLALAYCGMKITHALFFSDLLAALEGEPTGRISGRKLFKAAMLQSFLQPWGFFMLPIALLLTVPFPWVFAFFQNAQRVDENETSKESIHKAVEMARLWPRQNFFIQLFLLGAGFCVFINIAAALGTLPYLMKSLLGIDTVFTRSYHAYMNTTFFMTVAALAWAVLDPLVKAIYAMRCFRGTAIKTGRDLRLALDRVDANQSTDVSRLKTAALVTGMLLVGLAQPLLAAPNSKPVKTADAGANPEARASLAPARLDSLLKEEIRSARYGWRLPHKESPQAEEDNFFTRWMEKSYQHIASGLKSVGKGLRRFAHWLNNLFGSDDRHAERQRAPGSPSPLPIKFMMIALLAVFLCGIVIFLLRRMPNPLPTVAAVPAPKAEAPDLASDQIMADALPEEEWLRLMETLRRQGEDRLAIRALFLAMLAVLARKGWLAVARHKSNRDYQREVSLKSKRRPFVAESFRENCLRFDRIWYGLHAISEEDWAVSQSNFVKVSADET